MTCGYNMATGNATPSQANGSTLSDKELREVYEYEKILRLRDEIFAGKHPRLKVSVHAAAKGVVRAVQSPSLPNPRPTNGEISKVCQSSTPPSTRPNGFHGSVGQVNDALQKSPNAQRIPTSGTGSSGIDPIFLTKSEDLVKAEIQLQRQRIERALEEQVYLRKIISRQRISDQEAVPDFNISEVFARALDIVKPTSLAENNGANATATSSDSFDENTFYSSQINDSPSGDAESARRSPMGEQHAHPTENDRLHTDLHSARGSRAAQQNGHFRGRDAEQDWCLNDLEEHVYATLQPGHQATQKGRPQRYNREPPPPVHEEPDYSPPAADEAIPLGRDSQAARSWGEDLDEEQYTLRRSRAQAHHDTHGHPQSASKPVSPPSANVRIVRNHITSPFAPQPARVSPLAVAKVPQLPQDQRRGPEQQTRREYDVPLTAASPEVPPQQINPRKRRRAPDAGDRARNVTARRIEQSPEPYIKPEPLSPPPLSGIPSAAPAPARAQLRHRAPRPIHIDTISPREAHHGPLQPRRFQASSATFRHPLESPISPATRHVSSRMGHHGPGRDELDLRRVASVQYVRRVQSPMLEQLQYSPIEIQQPRQDSRTFVERQAAVEQYQYYRDPVPSQHGRYIRSERSLSPPPLRGTYATMDQTLPVMAPPPPRRIVMDQYGNKYYEAPRTVNVRASAAPPSRYAELEPAYERAPARHASKHVAPALFDNYEDVRYNQRLAQSPPVPHRFLEPQHDDGTSLRRYRQLEYPEEVVMPRSGAGQVLDYPAARHASHFEEVSIPREPIPRMHSVRPVSTRYEAATEYAPRTQSVHPDQRGPLRLAPRPELAPARLRELSVRVDDEARGAREYVNPDRAGYEYMPPSQHRREVGQAGPREVIMMDSPLGDDRRPARRF